MMGGMGGGGRSPKRQLTNLVSKLDLLTGKPLAIALSADQKKQVVDQLKGLEDKEELTEEDAQACLKSLLGAFETNKDVLEAVGFRWPTEGGPGGGQKPPATGRSPGGGPPGAGPPGGGPPEPPNPFKDDANSKALKSLRDKAEKK